METINQIDALVHPDYSLKGSDRPILTMDQIRRRHKWMERAQVLARNPKAILIYSSVFLYAKEGDSTLHSAPGRGQTHKEDEKRIGEMQKLLGDRFFLLPGIPLPDGEKLIGEFNSRRFTYHPNHTTLDVYGEWYNVCVNSWYVHLQQALSIPYQQIRRLPDLSLHTQDDINNLSIGKNIRRLLLANF